MATRLYLRDTVAASSPTTGEKSASRTHSGTSTPAQNLALDTVKGAAQTSNVVNSSAATTNQNVYMGRWSWPLQTGFTSIAAQTWTYAFRTAEGNAAANSFASLCLYIWRPSNNSVVGYIYDTDSQLGVEATGSGQVVTFSGSAVTGQAGDLLVLEAWTDQTQSMATNYANTFYYNGATDVVAGTNADAAAYIESPANLIAAAATYTQSAYRFRYDDGTETTATWRAANNTAINMVADTTLRLRFNVASATSAPTQNKTFQLRYRRNSSGTYADVNASSLYARSSASPNVADATATTEQMAGTGAFNAGTFDEVDGLATGYTAATATGQDTELEYSITVRSADVVAGDTLDFQLYSGGSAIDTYSQTPRITVVANSAGEARVPMTDPSTTLATGAGSGEIRFRAKKVGSGPTNPSVRVEVHDGDSATVLATPIANTQVGATGTDGELLTGTFDQSVLTTPNTTKLWIVTTNVVGASAQPLALEWNAAIVAAGGTTHNRSVADTIAAADASALRQTEAVADTIAFADARVTSFLLSRTATDTVAVTDARTLRLTRALADTVAAADARAATLAYARTVADTIQAVDARVLRQTKAIADTTPLADARAASFLLGRTVADSAGLTDARTLRLTRALADAITTADAGGASATLAYARTVADTLIAADARSLRQTKALSDAIASADTASSQAAGVINRAVSDAVATADARALRLTLALADTVATSDARVLRQIKALSDTIAAADSATASRLQSRSTSDSVAVSDARVATLLLLRAASDTLTTADARTLRRTLAVADTLAVVDAQNLRRSLLLADVIVTADARAVIKGQIRTLADTLGTADAISRSLAFARIVSDTVGTADGLSRQIAYSRSVQDILALSDATLITQRIVRVATDAIASADTAQAVYRVVRQAADALSIVDALTYQSGYFHKDAAALRLVKVAAEKRLAEIAKEERVLVVKA